MSGQYARGILAWQEVGAEPASRLISYEEINDELLLLYGWGDGGGGPTKEMLESARVLKNLPGLPRVELGKAEPYFERLEKRLAGHDVPVWDGELYLEYHRGTYTSQAYNKRANRLAEGLYHNAEWLSTLADVLTGQHNYPAESLRTGWELTLLNQFHDILPGSSIRQVYEDSREDYEKIQQIRQEAIEQAQRTILEGIALPTPSGVERETPRSTLHAAPPRYAFAETDADHVIVETVKQAEDGEAWIIRVYEYKQYRSQAVHLDFGQPIRHAAECNLMEEDEQPLAYHGRRLTFAIAPYEIKTFKLWF